jgi:cytochrome c oxidase subunit 2
MAGPSAIEIAARSWPQEPAVLLCLATAALLYSLGVARAWRVAGVGRGVGTGRALAGFLGLAAVAAALASPIEPLSGLVFSAHMAQHLLLVLVAAPLLVVAAPLLAVLWLMPAEARRRVVAGWRRRRVLRRGWHLLTHPGVAWALFVAVLWLWHLPVAYEAALLSEAVHAGEHLSLLAVAALFWWALLQPMGRRRLSLFGAPLVLFATAMQGGLLGAMIALSDVPWYGHYERVAQSIGFSALADQQLAGLLMWVPPGALYLAVACWLLYRAMVRLDTRLEGPLLLGPKAAEAGAPPRPDRPNGLESPDGGKSRRRPVEAGDWLSRAVAVAALALSGLGRAQVLDPAGPGAERIASIWWLMLVLAGIVCLVVYVLLLMAVFLGRGQARRPRRQGPDGPGRRNEARPGEARPPLGSGLFVVLGGIVIPILILVPLMLYSLGITAGLARPAADELTIEVIGHQWWWEVRYPDAGVVSANEIHLPAGRPVRLQLTSADVIHSFWAPRLQGKMDLIPGNINTLTIEAEETGVFSARCAEFCGVQHANMQLLVVAEPAERFNEWLSERQEAAPLPRDPLTREGMEVFLSSACVYCHTIEGTNATGRVGPDLTHVASRLTLGAGTVANTRGNLGGWIVNSQAIKPGNRMPPMYLGSEELQALLAYLESLE